MLGNPHTDLTGELSDSSSSFDGCTGTIFSEDAVECDNANYENKKHGGTYSNSISIFTVRNEARGYSLSPLEKRRIGSVLQSCSREDRGVTAKYMPHELTLKRLLKQLFIQNFTFRLACMFFDLCLKVIICLIYLVRVFSDDVSHYECGGSRCEPGRTSAEKETDTSINWYVLLWVQRSSTLWMCEVALSIISLAKCLLMIYVDTKGHRMNQICSSAFLLEMICSLPLLVTVIYPVKLKDLFVPVFLNCWLAKYYLVNIYNDLDRTRQRLQTISTTLLQQMVLLVVNIVCLVFTNVCFIQHLQRASPCNKLTMFESMYFVVVTFSFVGYGDRSPDIWIGQLFVILMICVALASIPRQIEGLLSTYLERQRTGGEYSFRAAQQDKHVVVCSSTLTQETLMDFLNEFYAQPKLEGYTVILLCPQDPDSSKQVILKDPKWTRRVIYMKGSSFKDQDLKRCRIHQAAACFFPASRPTQDKVQADRHTVLRSWAVKDFAPSCKQYIYLFHVTNRIHVNFAEHVVCEDEFKYALLANNCLYPGLSTLVSMLVHTSTGKEGRMAPETWQQVFGRHSGNEIYHMQLQKSAYFCKYEGETFSKTSADAHHRFGVALLAVLDSQAVSPHLQLNPGPEYRLKGQDYCFYMSITREEDIRISKDEALGSVPQQQALQKYHTEPQLIENPDESVFDRIISLVGNNIARITRRFTMAVNNSPNKVVVNSVSEDMQANDSNITMGHRCLAPHLQVVADDGCGTVGEDEDDGSGGDAENIEHRHRAGQVFQFYDDMGQEKLTTGPPPVNICSWSNQTSCHIMSEHRQHCCLVWATHCEHCTYKTASDERWGYQLMILAAEHATTGIFNFIVSLRTSCIGVNGLSAIVLLLEEEPDSLFLDIIAQFPLVYYIIGSIRKVDDLLLAGINKASHLVVVNRDSASDYGEEEILADSETIMAVQTIFKLFPRTHVVTELSQASNMRFMHFSAHDVRSQQASRLEQELNNAMTSSLYHMFRLPFAGGQVFSASMLDTLLYQTFVKGYLISFVRLLLGIDAEEGSGHLSSIRITEATALRFPEYGQLYQGLCSTTGEIPFAIYRTERIPSNKSENVISETCQEDKVLDSLACKHKSGEKTEPGTEIVQPSGTRVKSYSTVSQQYFSMISKSDQGDLNALIYNRLQTLELDQAGYCSIPQPTDTLSYIITNPSSKEKVKVGDIVYVIQPSSLYVKTSKHSFCQHPGTPSRYPRSTPSTPKDMLQEHPSLASTSSDKLQEHQSLASTS